MDTKADEWTCGRCGLVLPSPDGSRAPVTCLKELGGCERSSDGEDDASSTTWFPGRWSKAKMDLYLETEFGTEGRILFSHLVQTWEHYIEFGNPWHAELLSLFILQSYFYKALPAVFYI